MSSLSPEDALEYASASSFADSSFFVHLSKLKLNVMKLDMSYQDVIGYYNYTSLGPDQEPALNLSDSSYGELDFLKTNLPQDSYFLSMGKLLNVNTIDEFKNINKKDLLLESAMKMLSDIDNKKFIKKSELLSSFTILSFADLKTYKFYYWFAFPQLLSNWVQKGAIKPSITYTLEKEQKFTEQFYIIEPNSNTLKSLSTLFDHDTSSELSILFIDTCTYSKTASFALRNFLFALAYHNFKAVQINVVKYNNFKENFTVDFENSDYNSFMYNEPSYTPLVSGWEKTSRGKLGPKLADLGSLIDPLQLADQAIDLNLSLMKWRLVPELDLQIVRNSKVLILGSGTLGSYIARCLLAWGVRTITFVDNGKVSFSNPVRQPLFNYEDCLNGGSSKAETAATNLKKIFPLVNSTGYTLEIPMIGHPVKNESKEYNDYVKLKELYEQHDAVFLSLDSREARWLPTILGNAMNKIVINSALGFESYLVMRHGCINPKLNINDQIDGRLGCYYCNDIVAPKDSLTDRTLDQMCTVTRPGVALLASSLAAELFVSILQSPEKQYSKHIVNEKSNILGSLPHQLRGFLHNFELLKLNSNNFKCCTACSVSVINEYNERGWDFIKNALDDDDYLENLTGLKEFHQEAENAALLMDEFDDLDLEDDIS